MYELSASPRPLAIAEEAARAVVRVLPNLVRNVVAEMHTAPHAAGMTLPQFRILCRLSERDYRAAELARALEVGRPSLTVTADALVRRGLIERLRDLPSDRRGVLLRLTPAGRALYRALEERAVRGVSGLLSGTSPAERSALAFGLEALERGLRGAGFGSQPAALEAR